MQEMKFRVYNKKLNLWYYVPSLIFCGGFFYESDSDFINDTKLNPEDIDVEWYTGYWDIEASEIWQGDILKEDFSSNYGQAVFKDGMFQIEYKRYFRSENSKTFLSNETILLHDNFYFWEVIGNIHDNPELLG